MLQGVNNTICRPSYNSKVLNKNTDIKKNSLIHKKTREKKNQKNICKAPNLLGADGLQVLAAGVQPDLVEDDERVQYLPRRQIGQHRVRGVDRPKPFNRFKYYI